MNQSKLAVQLGNTAFYTENAVILQTMVNKDKQKKKKTFKNYRKSNKELNALIEKKF